MQPRTNIKKIAHNAKGQPCCSAKVRSGGICVDCGYRVPRNEKHDRKKRGVCPKCGGKMGCASTKLDVNGRCRLHRGCSRIGPSHPNWRHGRYSQHLTPRISARLNAILDDPKLLSNEVEVGLLTYRITQLAEKLDSNEGPSAWARVESAYEELKAGIAEENATQIKSAMQDLRDAIRRGAKDRETWEEIRETSEDRSRIAAREAKQQVDMQMMLTLEDGVALMGALVGVAVKQIDAMGEQFRAKVKALEQENADTVFDVEAAVGVLRLLQNKLKTDMSKELLRLTTVKPRDVDEGEAAVSA